MRAIDYLSIFFLLGAAPTWQASLDKLSAGLGTAFLVILLTGSIRSVLSELGPVGRSSRRRRQPRSLLHSPSSIKSDI